MDKITLKYYYLPGILVGLLFFNLIGYSQEQKESEESEKTKEHFIKITIFENRTRVTFPTHKQSLPIGFMIENMSFIKILAKLTHNMESNVADGDFPLFFTLLPNSVRFIPLKFKKDEKIFFVPLSPAAQELVIIINEKKDDYEVPSRE
ncbi:MAG: hypothetical protein HQK53_01595 [Oligoflexia bacterium]|nr:hypothetical protein [Oligoflexia bacterium]